MKPITAETVNELFEKAVTTSSKAWDAQLAYLGRVAEYNGRCLSHLADAGLTGARELAGAGSFARAIEVNTAYGETLRKELGRLRDENFSALQELQGELSEIYAATTGKAKKAAAASPAKPKAAGARKAA
jgi:hypothetical protein